MTRSATPALISPEALGLLRALRLLKTVRHYDDTGLQLVALGLAATHKGLLAITDKGKDYLKDTKRAEKAVRKGRELDGKGAGRKQGRAGGRARSDAAPMMAAF